MKLIPALFTTAAIFALGGADTHAGYLPTGDEHEAGEEAHYTPALMKFSSEDELAEILDDGAILLRRRADMALLYIPNRNMKKIKGNPRSKGRLYSGRRMIPAMDKALEWYEAGNIPAGKALPSPFTGKGVVAGLCDLGFDPSHPNFLTPDKSATRVRLITQYKESRGEGIALETPGQIESWRTDSVEYAHATHVAGILAGADDTLGYAGVARDADIVMSSSELSDVGLLAGVEDIIEYAAKVGKPAVVNLSMGNYVGPHDGTSLFSQYLDLLGEEAIIVLSAGNEGNRTNTMRIDFDAECTGVSARISDAQWTQFDMTGMVDFWSGDHRELSLEPLVYDEMTQEVVYRFPVFTFHDGQSLLITTEDGASGDDETLKVDEEFRRYYKGEMLLTGGVDPENGRYNVSMQYDMHTTVQSEAGAWARYNLAFKVYGTPGQHADIFADGQYSRLKRMPGEPSPGADASFSDLATGHNVISVGMSNNRERIPFLNGNHADYSDWTPGGANIHSSYMTLLDGRVMPLTVAPGFPIISSASTPWIEAHPELKGEMSGMSEYEGKEYYWVQNGGTSMSAPYVAGFIATWLEADPDLTVADVKQIIAETNRRDEVDPADPRNGAGRFDALAGLRKILERVSVTGASISGKGFSAYFNEGELHVVNPEMSEISVSIHDVAGRLISTMSDSGAYITMRPEAAAHDGVLIISISDDRGNRKVLKCLVDM